MSLVGFRGSTICRLTVLRARLYLKVPVGQDHKYQDSHHGEGEAKGSLLTVPCLGLPHDEPPTRKDHEEQEADEVGDKRSRNRPALRTIENRSRRVPSPKKKYAPTRNNSPARASPKMTIANVACQSSGVVMARYISLLPGNVVSMDIRFFTNKKFVW